MRASEADAEERRMVTSQQDKHGTNEGALWGGRFAGGPSDALAALSPGEGDTVVVTAPSSLGASTVERLREDAAGATVVLLEPDHTVLELFGLPDEAYVGRLAYRGLAMRACPALRVLDGVEVSEKEREKAERLLASLVDARRAPGA